MFSLGPITIRWYGVFFALSFLGGLYIMTKVFERENKPEDDINYLFYYMIAGTVIGARLGHCFFYEPDYYLLHPAEIIKVWHGGLASHGGVLGIVTAMYFYSRSRPEQPLVWILDRLTLPAMLGAGFIRLGNVFNSEIIGIPTDVPWAFIFARIDMLPRHPVQLYESIVYFLIFAFLMLAYWKWDWWKQRGLLLGSLLTSVFSARFVLEFLKTRQADYGHELPISVGQWLSVPAVLIGIFLIFQSIQQGQAEKLR